MYRQRRLAEEDMTTPLSGTMRKSINLHYVSYVFVKLLSVGVIRQSWKHSSQRKDVRLLKKWSQQPKMEFENDSSSARCGFDVCRQP